MKSGVILGCLVGAAALSGCGLFRQEKLTPDEFAVVAKAPLVVPPEYNLLPPRPGEPRPQELDSSLSARQALIGSAPSADQSAGEQTLVAQAGGLSADPAIRAQIERETAGVVYKSGGFADRILFWNGRDNADLEEDPLDPEAEIARLEERIRRVESINSVTGGQDVEIERNRSGRLRLPGL